MFFKRFTTCKPPQGCSAHELASLKSIEKEWYQFHYSIIYQPPGEIPQTKGSWTNTDYVAEMLEHLKKDEAEGTTLLVISSHCGDISVEDADQWLQMREVEREVWEEVSEDEEALIREHLSRAKEQRFKHEPYEDLTEWQKSLYVIKLYLCRWLHLRWKPRHGSFPETLCAVLIYHRKTYAGWEEQYIEVGRGLFKNWFYRLHGESDWNM